MKASLIPNFRGADVIRVLRVVTLEGEGTVENVAREVTTYLDLDGNVLFVADPCPPGTPLGETVLVDGKPVPQGQ